MKICLTIYSSPWSKFTGGGQLAVHHLACALQKIGHQVHVLYSKSPNEKIIQPVPYTIHWAHHFEFPTFNLNIFSFARALKRLMKKEKFDVIHGNAEESFFSSDIAREFGAGYLFTSHANMIPKTGMIKGILNPLLFLKTLNNYLLRSTASKASRIITFSNFSKQLVLNGLGKNCEEKVEVVSPGIDATWFDIKRTKNFSHELGLWGRMEEQKGITELLYALKKVSTRIPDVMLHLIGEGNMTEIYKKQAKQLGILDRIIFHGWMGMNEIQKLSTKLAIGVFPSRVESFGLAMAEAMGAGLPIIATRVGALPEFIKDGVTGTLVPQEDSSFLCLAILNVFEHPERTDEIAAVGREQVKKKFSWDTAAKRMTEIYQSVKHEI